MIDHAQRVLIVLLIDHVIRGTFDLDLDNNKCSAGRRQLTHKRNKFVIPFASVSGDSSG